MAAWPAARGGCAGVEPQDWTRVLKPFATHRRVARTHLEGAVAEAERRGGEALRNLVRVGWWVGLCLLCGSLEWAGKHPSLFLKKRVSRNALIGSGAGCRSGEWAAIWRRGVSDKFVMTKTRDPPRNI